MASWDWQLYCTDMVTSEVAPKCFGAAGYERVVAAYRSMLRENPDLFRDLGI
mgnify:CR=1 FL=1